MSHYAVHIALPAETKREDIPNLLDERMEPFNENREVEPYRDYESGDPKDHWAYETIMEQSEAIEPATKALPAPGTDNTPQEVNWQDFARLYTAHYKDSDQGSMLYDADKGAAYTMSTYNPDSKWDWWVVGGRWSGYWRPTDAFTTALFAEGSDPANTPHVSPEVFPAAKNNRRATDGLRLDGGRRKHLDFDNVIAEAVHEAREEYLLYTSHLDGKPELKTFDQIQEAALAAHPGIKEAPREERHKFMQRCRTAYRDQPGFSWVDEYRAENKVMLDLTEIIRSQRTSEEAWLARARWGALPVYAHIDLDNEWHSPGRMGWFGMSTESDVQSLAYDEAATTYLRDLPEDTWIITLDLHI